MKGFFCFMLSALLIVITGCSDGSDNADGEHSQNAHLLSVNVKVIEAVEDSDKLFKVEALETCGKRIKQGDAILVTADSSDISSVLASYQENNSFRIYFPTVNDTSDRISVTCFDIVQYDSVGKIVNQDAPKDVSPEPTQTPPPEATAAPTAEPENIFDKIPTEGNVWKINEMEGEFGRSRSHSSPDFRHEIFHEMTREEVLAYFGMKLDLQDFLPYLQESPDAKYGFYEYRSVDGRNARIELQESFYYCDKESLSMYPEQWEQYVIVDFAEGSLPDFSNLNARFSEELRNHWEPEVSVIQGQEVRIVHYTVRREDFVYGPYYFADFLNNNLGITIEALGMEWEDVKKVIEYLVFYALEREGG